MPIITVESVGELSREQKQQIIEKMTEVVVQVIGKPASTVYVRIDEIKGANFGVGGRPLG